MGSANRSVVLESYARGAPITEANFSVRTGPAPTLDDGEVVLETLALSVDPYMRGCMSGLDTFFLPQFVLGEPIHSMGVGRVVASRLAQHAPGDLVVGALDWADVTAWSANDRIIGSGVLQPVPASVTKVTHMLGALGLNGTTAFFGVVAVARPRRGETFLVSGAAGGVGSLAGQIARILGARVIGLASSAAKRATLVDTLGFEAALDYRSPTLVEELLALAPHGPDVYFDNVGGELSQTIMSNMIRPARVIECGQISTYDDDDGGWKVDIRPIHGRGLRFESFTPSQFSEFTPGAVAQLDHWLSTGKLIALETEYHGLDEAARAMIELFHGGNTGKAVVNVADPAG